MKTPPIPTKNNPDSIPVLYTLADLARTFQKSPDWVYHNWRQWVAHKMINVYYIGSRPRFKPADVEKLMKSFQQKASGGTLGRGKV